MRSSFRVILAALAALLVLAVAVPAAGAAVTATQITSPVDGTHVSLGPDDPDAITVSGTAAGANGDPIDIHCFSLRVDGGLETGLSGGGPLVSTTVDAGRFSATVTLSDIALSPCVLKAVPGGDTGPDLDDDATDTAFAGAHFAQGGRFEPDGTPGDTYLVSFSGFAGNGQLWSAGYSGLSSNYTVEPVGGLPQQSWLLFTAAGFLGNGSTFPGASRSHVLVDGRNAYLADAATFLYPEAADAPGAPAIAFSDFTHDPATGRVSFTESEPIVRCAAASDPAPGNVDETTCPAFADTGVRFTRRVVVDHDGGQTVFRDRFTSTDGTAHDLDLLYEQDVVSDAAGGSVNQLPTQFAFPWVDGDPSQAGSYHEHATGDVIAGAPDGPAAVYVWPNEGQPTSTGGRTVRYAKGSIVTSLPPAQVRFVDPGQYFQGSMDHGFEMGYALGVPAGDSADVTHVYSFAFTDATLAALTDDAEVVAAAPPATPALTPEAATFADQAAGSASAERTFTLSNPAGSATSLAVTGVDLAGADAAQFLLTGGTCRQAGGTFAAVAPGGSCTATVAFAPTAGGAKAAALRIATDAGAVQSALSGTGVATAATQTTTTTTPGATTAGGPFSVAPTTESFGTVAVGRSATRAITVRADGPAPVAFPRGAAALRGSAAFAVIADGCAGRTLQPAATCVVRVRFRPSAAGARATTLTVSSTANAGGRAVALDGRGAGAVAIVSRPLTVRRDGTVRLRLRCPAALGTGCRTHGSAQVRLVPRGAGTKRPTTILALGRLPSVTIASGKSRTVTLRVPDATMAALRPRVGRPLAGRVTLSTVTAQGPAFPSVRAATVVLSRARP